MDDNYREFLKNYRLNKRRELLDGLKCDCCGGFPIHLVHFCDRCYKKYFRIEEK